MPFEQLSNNSLTLNIIINTSSVDKMSMVYNLFLNGVNKGIVFQNAVMLKWAMIHPVVQYDVTTLPSDISSRVPLGKVHLDNGNSYITKAAYTLKRTLGVLCRQVIRTKLLSIKCSLLLLIAFLAF